MSNPGTINREVAKIIADILQEELTLDDAHCLLGDQKWRLPEDEAMFCVVFDDTIKPLGSVKYLDTVSTSPTLGSEIQQISGVHAIRVEIMSFSNEARVRKEEVMMALNSLYAEQQAESAGIQIGRPQTPVNASDAEGTSRLLRYVIHVNVSALHQKVKVLPQYGYYDKFNNAVVDQTAKPPEVHINE